MSLYNQVSNLLKDGPVWVELLDKMQLCVIDEKYDHFSAKLILCNPKSKTYRVNFNHINRILEEYL